MIPDWVRALIDAATPHVPADFVGHVEIYVSQGGISNVTVKQEWARTKAGGAS